MHEEESHLIRGMRQNMIKNLRREAQLSPIVLDVMAGVSRHLFVSKSFEKKAYLLKALPIVDGQTISNPRTVAYQTTLLDVREGDKVLEIGMGSGYQTLILLKMKARVYSIERHQQLFNRTVKLFESLKDSEIRTNLTVYHGDGFLGLVDIAPFDRILLTCVAFKEVPQNLFDQLKVRGKMVLPLDIEGEQHIYVVEKTDEGTMLLRKEERCHFVPMLQGTVKSNV